MKLIKIANRTIKQATMEDMWKHWMGDNNVQEDRLKSVPTDQLRKMILWAENDNQFLEQEWGIDQGINLDDYYRELKRMNDELASRRIRPAK